MSEFQLGLLVIGAVVIALVYGYNLWQERRFRQKTDAAFLRNQTDVLVDVPKNQVRDGLRMEPMLRGTEGGNYSVLSPVPTLVSEHRIVDSELPDTHIDLSEEAPLIATDESASGVDQEDQQALVAALLDPGIDYIAEVKFEAPVEFSDPLQILMPKRVQTLVCSDAGQWRVATAAPLGRVQGLSIGVQMVDRNGALSESELSDFCGQVQGTAERFHGNATFPQRQQKLAAARDLDRFCADVDVLIGISLVATQPFNGTKLRTLAEAHGMQLEPDGLFHYLSDSGNSLYTIANRDNTPFTLHSLLDRQFSAVTLLFDVPRVAGSMEVFDCALGFARQLAQALGCQMVDDNQQRLSENGINAIRHQLKQIYSRMEDRGIAPGSIAALRLFA